jgi:hypothetical protein
MLNIHLGYPHVHMSYPAYNPQLLKLNISNIHSRYPVDILNYIHQNIHQRMTKIQNISKYIQSYPPISNNIQRDSDHSSISNDSRQLAGRGTEERTRLGWPFFVLKIFILKTMMLRDVTRLLNERKHLKMVIRSVPDSLSLILGRAE